MGKLGNEWMSESVDENMGNTHSLNNSSTHLPEKGETMKTHKDLDIWKRGIELVTEVYKLTRNFPREETYGLSSQMRRAAVSYPSNIAEGAARNSKADYSRFVYIALGSLSELETQVIISKNLAYTSDIEKLLNEIEILRKMTLNFIKHLKRVNE